MLLSQDAARRRCAAALTATLLGLLATPVEAIESRESRSPLASHAFVSERLQPRAAAAAGRRGDGFAGARRA